ncbi:MAG TPA: hypothetical protein VMP03_08930, partial [Methylomirabilota bacterium]|nr:hypothetical protein [Methylomirabilota bacterium]
MLQGADDFELQVVDSSLAQADIDIRRERPAGMILDVGEGGPDALAALRSFVRKAGEGIPTIVVTDTLDPEAARTFLKLKLNDFLVKPVASADLLRTIRRMLETAGEEEEVANAQIYSFVPATGGAGNTTLVLQTAFLLHEQAAGRQQKTCVV